MSLFICSKCGAIENHSCVKGSLDGKITKYPNMHLIDMHGNDSDVIFILDENDNEVLFKRPDEIMMLCSECNTGVWHGEFDKVIVSDDSEDMYLSRYSRYNYITKTGNHLHDVLVKTGDDSYKLITPLLKTFADWITPAYNKHYGTNINNISIMANNDIRIDWLLEVFLADPDMFVYSVADRLFDAPDVNSDYLYNFSLFARDCVKDDINNISRYRTIRDLEGFIKLITNHDAPLSDMLVSFQMYRNMVNNKTNPDRGIDLRNEISSFMSRMYGMALANGGSMSGHDEMKAMLDELKYNGVRKNIKPHWKKLQTEDDRNDRLKKAEEKRQRKLEKKNVYKNN